jgi:hypothetical protein
MNTAEQAYRERQKRRDEKQGEKQAAGAPLFEDQRRVSFGGLLRRELRGLLGDEQTAVGRLVELSSDPARRGSDIAAQQLAERRALASEVVLLAARHELLPWLRLAELDPSDRQALGL